MLHLFHLSIDGHLDCFYVLTTVNSNTVNTVCMYHFKLVFFGYMPRSGIAGSYGNFTHGHHQMVNTKIRLIIIFAAKDGEALSVQFSSVAQSCLTLCDPMDHSTPGLPVHHQLPEFT